YGVGGESLNGKTVLITGGAGAVGFYAIQAAKFLGATVAATVSGEDKKTHAARANPDYIINYKTEDVAARVLDITGGEGADKIIEVEFGGNLAATAKALKAGGTIAAYGSAANPNPALPFYPLMFNNATVKMFFIYQIGETARQKTLSLIKEIEPKLTHAVSETFPLAETQKAHATVEAAKQTGKVIVEIN
ncbi:MAG: zinc-binding dehydrogenase, partial [Betaproteobacteria bacterium]|nr:zinc-binding dehydrogenase [Betaproteobacteria bacterium]